MRKAIALTGLSIGAFGILNFNSSSSSNAQPKGSADKKSDASSKGLTKTFIWGNGQYQARPDALVQFKNFEPKLIKSFLGRDKPNFKTIKFGEHHTVGIDMNDNLYIWAKKVLYSHKDPEIDDHEQSDIYLLDKMQNVKDVAFTKGFVWALKTNGEIVQWPLGIFVLAKENFLGECYFFNVQ